jgi:hypothetical protein
MLLPSFAPTFQRGRSIEQRFVLVLDELNNAMSPNHCGRIRLHAHENKLSMRGTYYDSIELLQHKEGFRPVCKDACSEWQIPAKKSGDVAALQELCQILSLLLIQQKPPEQAVRGCMRKQKASVELNFNTDPTV